MFTADMAGEKQIAAAKTIKGCPASPMQQGMPSLSPPHAGVHMEQVIFTLPEELNVAAFRHAWERAVKRHTILRTGFRVAGLVPQQGVHHQVRLHFAWKDWSGLTEREHPCFPQDKSVHEHFETQVEHTPDTVALVYFKGEVSYRELDNQANRVAIHLRSLAVEPDVPVEKATAIEFAREIERRTPRTAAKRWALTRVWRAHHCLTLVPLTPARKWQSTTEA
jgi:non-ribosomal peptide synthetase component F